MGMFAKFDVSRGIGDIGGKLYSVDHNKREAYEHDSDTLSIIAVAKMSWQDVTAVPIQRSKEKECKGCGSVQFVDDVCIYCDRER